MLSHQHHQVTWLELPFDVATQYGHRISEIKQTITNHVFLWVQHHETTAVRMAQACHCVHKKTKASFKRDRQRDGVIGRQTDIMRLYLLTDKLQVCDEFPTTAITTSTTLSSITLGRIPTQAFNAASRLPNEGISMFSRAGALKASLSCGRCSSRSNAYNNRNTNC